MEKIHLCQVLQTRWEIFRPKLLIIISIFNNQYYNKKVQVLVNN
nr:MAG TPA: hypothetical protein [Caudoviricetes sp.]